MKFKITNLSILFNLEDSLWSSVDTQKSKEKKETDKQKIDNLPKNVQDFLWLKWNKNTEVKISKNKKWIMNLYFTNTYSLRKKCNRS